MAKALPSNYSGFFKWLSCVKINLRLTYERGPGPL